MSGPPTIDVSQLPSVSLDSRSPAWWGNVLFMVIETTTMALMIVSYFYAWQGSGEWPPPHADATIAVAQRFPAPGWRRSICWRWS